jgi:hypothetical protein
MEGNQVHEQKRLQDRRLGEDGRKGKQLGFAIQVLESQIYWNKANMGLLVQ